MNDLINQLQGETEASLSRCADISQERCVIMPVDITEWTGSLALTEVEEQPAKPLTVKYGSLEIDALGKVFTPTQVRAQCTRMLELASNALHL